MKNKYVDYIYVDKVVYVNKDSSKVFLKKKRRHFEVTLISH